MKKKIKPEVYVSEIDFMKMIEALEKNSMRKLDGMMFHVDGETFIIKKLKS
jgi:hypothetical protein